MSTQPRAHDAPPPAGHLAEWIEDAAVLVMVFCAVAILAAVGLFMIVI